MSDAELLAEWSRLLLATLRAAGLREVVISPGSRSTPFAWAASQQTGLRCHSLIDERSAAFFALGQARLTGQPSLLICTSGSAGANYFPAVVEAHASSTPLLVLTADRPFELQHCQAPQTVDQLRFFGGYSEFFELGAPDASAGALAALQRAAAQAHAASLSPRPGPVQLNARARKPLEPPTAPTATSASAARVTALLEAGPTRFWRGAPRLAKGLTPELAREAAQALRPLIVIGTLPVSSALDPEELQTIVDHAGAPLFAEAGSQLRFGAGAATSADALPWLLACPSFAGAYKADWILQLGAPPIAGAFGPYIEGLGPIARHVVSAHAWADPYGGASSVIQADPAEFMHGLSSAFTSRSSLKSAKREDRSKRLLLDCNEQAWRVIDACITLAADAPLSEAAATRTLCRALPQGSLFMVGNSLPIRHVDAFCRAEARGLRVLTQRGASGIDGLISGAAGAAEVAKTATTLLIGDVSFLHDIGGLWAARGITQPLVIAVLNNGGGRIFEQLPLGTRELPEALMRLWTTPQNLDLSHAARLFGLEFARAATTAELERALQAGYRHPGVTLLDIVVPPHGAAELQRQILARLDPALRDLLRAKA